MRAKQMIINLFLRYFPRNIVDDVKNLPCLKSAPHVKFLESNIYDTN
jgi:hypothetical protein